MKPTRYEINKKTGVYYVQTVEGVELPVIDITHPAFTVSEPSAAEMETMLKKSDADGANFNRMPSLLRKFFLWVFCRQSVLMRGLICSSGTYLSGMNTYLLKLGPENLGMNYRKPLDKVIAASLPALSTRLRLQDMVQLTVQAITPVLEQRPGYPFHLINIAGGPCSDSLNILILLRKQYPELLKNRAIKIHAFDLESAAPTFAKRAFSALQVQGAPLQGLNATMEYTPYNWHVTQDLHTKLSALSLQQSVVVVTAEGGLFDYGSTEDISANLDILYALTSSDTVLTGTITPPQRPGEGMAQVGGATTVARSLNEFGDLARENGWTIIESRDRLINYVVRMHKA
jgi:hypothetical protein